MFKGLEVILDYINNNDLLKIEDGRYDIIEDEVYFNVVSVDLKDEGIYEYHKNYIDLHIDLSGEEYILFSDFDSATMVKEYDSEQDYALVNGDESVRCILKKDKFVLCMLDEPHMPCIKTKNSEKVKKIIFKLKVKHDEKTS